MSILQNLQRLRDRARGAGAGGHLLTGDALDEAHAGGRGGTLAPILRRYDDTPEAERLGGDHTHVSALID